MTGRNQQNSLLGKIAAYTEILAKDPGSTIFVSLSEAYRKTGMLDDARQVIENGLEKHPDFSPAHIVYARILCQQGEYDASSEAFQKALNFDPESLAALVGYARLHILLGQETQARTLLLDARDLSPADPVINKLLLSLPEPQPELEPEPALQEEPVAETVVEEVVEGEVAEPVVEDVVEEVAAEPVVEEAAEEEAVEPEDVLEPEDEDDDFEDQDEPTTPPLASSTLADLYLQQGLTEQALEMYRQLSADNPDNLEYRRKIRDIEGDSEMSAADSAFSDIETEQTVVEPVEETAADEDDAPAALYDSTVSAEKAGDEKILETLNRWLDSIRKRRENV